MLGWKPGSREPKPPPEVLASLAHFAVLERKAKRGDLPAEGRKLDEFPRAYRTSYALRRMKGSLDNRKLVVERFLSFAARNCMVMLSDVTPTRCQDDMNDVTRLLAEIEQGDRQAADLLLPLVYDELRKLASQKLAHEKPGQTLQATALVHEAFLRLVDAEQAGRWDNRRHYFAAAAEAMRRILIENARRKRAEKHGGGRTRVDLDAADAVSHAEQDDLLDLDDALSRLAGEDPDAAQVVRLRLFAGLSVEQAAEVLGVSRAGAYQQWTYARAWLNARLRDED